MWGGIESRGKGCMQEREARERGGHMRSEDVCREGGTEFFFRGQNSRQVCYHPKDPVMLKMLRS